MAREIHDTLAQDLTAIALHVESAMRQVRRNPQQAQQRLERALSTARESLEEARRSVQDLRTTPLAGRSLPQALAALARSFTSETGIRVHVQVSGRCVLPLRAEAELFRIVQEALQNVRKHAQATEVSVRLRSAPHRVTLVVADNGRGFDHRSHPQRASARVADWRDGNGIIGMRERAALLGGTLRIASRPGAGTRLTATIPLDGSLFNPPAVTPATPATPASAPEAASPTLAAAAAEAAP
jgi:two-component system NarL family sensor kinase